MKRRGFLRALGAAGGALASSRWLAAGTAAATKTLPALVTSAWKNPAADGPDWIRDAYILRVGDRYYLTGTRRAPVRVPARRDAARRLHDHRFQLLRAAPGCRAQ